MNRLASFLLVMAATTAAGCATHPEPVFTGLLAPLKNCRSQYTEIDARIDAAGVRDSAFYRIPGYPYLRTDRLMASYGNEVKSINEVGGWVRRMREFDQEAREFEYSNLGLSQQEAANFRYELQNCGRGLAAVELDDDAAIKRLAAAAQPDDDYSDVARTFGLYPLAVPLLKARIADEQQSIRAEFAKPLTELDAPGTPVFWEAQANEDLGLIPKNLGKASPDELGLPGLVDSAWKAIAEANAPRLLIETGDAREQPGAPIWTAQGASVDVSKPQLNYQIGFTRFGGQSLTQIAYFAWFKRGAAAPEKKTAPAIDGLIWRVTLDTQGRPLVYESLRASGRDHAWFPAQPLARRPRDGYWQEPVLFPQESLAPLSPVLRLKAGEHTVRRLLATAQGTTQSARTYELRRYEDLYILPLPGGGTRSLFTADGTVPGSAAPDPAWLWSSGVRNPGALRQYGHLVTAYVGRSQFDDPFLMETVFVPPNAGAQEAGSVASGSK